MLLFARRGRGHVLAQKRLAFFPSRMYIKEFTFSFCCLSHVCCLWREIGLCKAKSLRKGKTRDPQSDFYNSPSCVFLTSYVLFTLACLSCVYVLKYKETDNSERQLFKTVQHLFRSKRFLGFGSSFPCWHGTCWEQFRLGVESVQCVCLIKWERAQAYHPNRVCSIKKLPGGGEDAYLPHPDGSSCSFPPSDAHCQQVTLQVLEFQAPRGT